MATDQNRVILGPLTTATWESPASCAVVVEGCAGTSTCSYGYQAQSCYATPSGSTISYGDEDNTDCWPPRASFVTTPIPPLTGWGFYSPGIICPTGMIQACTATYGGASGWPVQFGLTEGETAIGCCPRYIFPTPISSYEANHNVAAFTAPTAFGKPVYSLRLQRAFK
jgi:hypothetical protein